MVVKSLPLPSIHWFLVWCDKADWSLQTRISTIAKQKVSLGRVSFRQVKGAIFLKPGCHVLILGIQQTHLEISQMHHKWPACLLRKSPCNLDSPTRCSDGGLM